jgi:hypothetical protein
MDERNLEQAMDIVAKLLDGEEIGRSPSRNIALYEEYSSNAEVYDLVQAMVKRMNLRLYEYQYGLYLTAGENNQTFGFTNEELKRILGVRLNKEMYLCYFILYQTVLFFYRDSAAPNLNEYIRLEDVIRSVDRSLNPILEDLEVVVEGETQEESFRALSLLWSELPLVTGEESSGVRAAKNSKSGYVKLTFNFLVSQKLLLEEKERYYPKDRLRALIENYFEEYQGRLYELLQKRPADRGEEENHATY